MAFGYLTRGRVLETDITSLEVFRGDKICLKKILKSLLMDVRTRTDVLKHFVWVQTLLV